jgi:hypothetical protein
MRVRLLVVVLTLALAAAAICQEETLMFTTLPENPHRSFHVEGECLACHDTYAGAMDPHEFVLPVSEMCLRESCHTAAKLGRSHPVGVDVRASKSIEAVPENIPLEDNMVSCGSCHQPHGEWLSVNRCYNTQEAKGFLVTTAGGEERLTPYFKTYYLRIPGDPEEGFTALCNSCHPR